MWVVDCDFKGGKLSWGRKSKSVNLLDVCPESQSDLECFPDTFSYLQKNERQMIP